MQKGEMQRRNEGEKKKKDLMSCRQTGDQKRVKSGISCGCVDLYIVCVCVCIVAVSAARQWVGSAAIRLEPQEAQRLITMNIHTMVYHNNTLRLSL